MNLLLVGASSFIGREIYTQAKNMGINIIGTATHPKNEWLPFDLKTDDIRDVLEKSGLSSCQHRGENVYAIITAFYCGNEKTVEKISEAEQVNLIGMKKMLDVFHKRGVKSLFFSSEQVFDGYKGECYDETDPVSPVLTYGKHKAEIEKYIMDKMPEMLIYRLSQNLDIYPEGIQIFNDLYYRYMRGERRFKAIQGQVFSPTYVGDTARWSIEGLKIGLSGIYHCANSEKMSRGELMRRFLNKIAQDVEVTEVPLEYFRFKEKRPMDVRLNINKIKTQIKEIDFWPVDKIIENFVSNLRGRKIY